MIVKVCGVRDPEVASAAVDAGADWIGLVFEPRSPRYVDAARAQAVAQAVDGRADLVGVFVEPSARDCRAAVASHRLAALQVHGSMDPGFVADSPVPVICGINVASWSAALTLQWWPDCLVLLDAGAENGSLPGGTGRRVDIALAAEVARHRRILLAGGLGPENVRDAIRRVRPEGVDASSGLETAPGVKDVRLVDDFVRTARAAFDELARER